MEYTNDELYTAWCALHIAIDHVVEHESPGKHRSEKIDIFHKTAHQFYLELQKRGFWNS